MRNKGTNAAPGERSKVRVVMVEFEGNSADLQQLAQTLANAVRPQHIVTVLPRTAAPAELPAAPAANGHARDLSTDYPDAYVSSESEDPPADHGPASQKPSNVRKRKLKTPNVIEDIDFGGQPIPFREFMDDLRADEHNQRYLGIAQWFKDYRQVLEIGADHIYTCYKFLGLQVSKDVTAPFRSLKKMGGVARDESSGMYRITHIGENVLTQARKKN